MAARRSLFEELSQISSVGVNTRSENAFNIAIRFLSLLRETVDDDREYDLLVKAWLRAVKDEDFTKFTRVYKKYIGENPS